MVNAGGEQNISLKSDRSERNTLLYGSEQRVYIE